MPWPHLLQTLRFGAAASCADSCCHSRQRWQAAAASPATPSSWRAPARQPSGDEGLKGAGQLASASRSEHLLLDMEGVLLAHFGAMSVVHSGASTLPVPSLLGHGDNPVSQSVSDPSSAALASLCTPQLQACLAAGLLPCRIPWQPCVGQGPTPVRAEDRAAVQGLGSHWQTLAAAGLYSAGSSRASASGSWV